MLLVVEHEAVVLDAVQTVEPALQELFLRGAGGEATEVILAFAPELSEEFVLVGIGVDGGNGLGTYEAVDVDSEDFLRQLDAVLPGVPQPIDEEVGNGLRLYLVGQ